MIKKFRVGAVSYMNTKPLVWGLEERQDLVDLFFEVPSKLSQMFECGMLDIALLPAVSYFGHDKYRIIPGISIAAKGFVKSVNLFLKKDIRKIKKVALDTSSRTSRILTVVILKKLYGLSPEFVDISQKIDIEKIDSDAVLLIGDNAMNIQNKKFEVIDLGNEWYKLTSLPFVFAFWVTKQNTKLNGFDKILQETKEKGIKAIDEIAAIESKRLNFSKEECASYLSKSILYDLQEEEINGLKRFHDYALEMDLISQNSKSAVSRITNQNHNDFVKFYSNPEN